MNYSVNTKIHSCDVSLNLFPFWNLFLKFFPLFETTNQRPASIAHAYNLSYLEGRDRRIEFKVNWGKKLVSSYLNK
jgi:hypothetical protein